MYMYICMYTYVEKKKKEKEERYPEFTELNRIGQCGGERRWSSQYFHSLLLLHSFLVLVQLQSPIVNSNLCIDPLLYRYMVYLKDTFSVILLSSLFYSHSHLTAFPLPTNYHDKRRTKAWNLMNEWEENWWKGRWKSFIYYKNRLLSLHHIHTYWDK